MSRCLLWLGELALDAGDHSSAMTSLTEAVASATALDARSEPAAGLSALADLAAREGRAEDAAALRRRRAVVERGAAGGAAR